VSGVEQLAIRSTGYLDPVARTLVEAAMADLAGRYGGTGDDTPVASADFRPPNGDFLVAYVDGVPVACGGWRSHGRDNPVAEVKRMFTLPLVRRRGVARAVLRAVEDSARMAGLTRIVLETGARQPEAIAMYEAAGYTLIPNFGYYRDEPDVRSFGREL
jgi:GNAT superfamily N-acetyltransferase